MKADHDIVTGCGGSWNTGASDVVPKQPCLASKRGQLTTGYAKLWGKRHAVGVPRVWRRGK